MKIRMLLAVFVAGVLLNVVFYNTSQMDYAHDVLFVMRDCFHFLWGVAIGVAIMWPKGKQAKANRYRVMCTFTDIDYIGSNEYVTRQEALNRVSDHVIDPDCTSVVLIDTKKSVVSLLKGESIDLYRPGLDKTMPGWRLENV